ncbi:hypothetical protein ACH5RR_037815 [Cinchona calisaya]|uniref:Terpene synthase N-terminal domain-containing protein n=1 Tax=Cinchona calisaya TaxID=153742 RepID=A0ABD2Y9L2_9GENT
MYSFITLGNQSLLLIFRPIPMTSFYPKRTVRVQARPISAISNELPSLARRSANFQPSIWGDHFLADASDDIKENNSNQEKQKHQLLKEVVEKIQSETPNKTPQILELIDAIQRLGVAYHFEREIEASLRNIYNSFDEFNDEDDNDLHVVALRFRLLRQHGHYVPCGGGKAWTVRRIFLLQETEL